MKAAWDGDGIKGWKLPTPMRISVFGWVLVVWRGSLLITLLLGGLAILLFVRLFERPICGQGRPVTPFITQFVCRISIAILGISYRRTGTMIRGQGAIVANHSSWLDIFMLNAGGCLYFVSKAEVAGWPGIGWLARATGTLFIKRDPKAAASQVHEFNQRLSQGHKLLFFPEGTSSDGHRVLPFKATLFAAFLAPEIKHEMQIQPVSVTYSAPKHQDERFYGWWGQMELAPHLLQVLAAWPQGHVEVTYLKPIQMSGFENRKTLAATCEEQVRAGLGR